MVTGDPQAGTTTESDLFAGVRRDAVVVVGGKSSRPGIEEQPPVSSKTMLAGDADLGVKAGSGKAAGSASCFYRKM